MFGVRLVMLSWLGCAFWEAKEREIMRRAAGRAGTCSNLRHAIPTAYLGSGGLGNTPILGESVIQWDLFRDRLTNKTHKRTDFWHKQYKTRCNGTAATTDIEQGLQLQATTALETEFNLKTMLTFDLSPLIGLGVDRSFFKKSGLLFDFMMSRITDNKSSSVSNHNKTLCTL